MRNNSELIELTTEIVASFVSNNTIASSDVPALITRVHGALNDVAQAPLGPTVEPQKPAVPVKKSITPDYVICLEDGLKFKSLKRHLKTKYNMTPEEYRRKWGLSVDYPMVAPNYAKTRSDLAKKIGLGRKPAVAKSAAKPAAKAKAKAKPIEAKTAPAPRKSSAPKAAAKKKTTTAR